MVVPERLFEKILASTTEDIGMYIVTEEGDDVFSDLSYKSIGSYSDLEDLRSKKTVLFDFTLDSLLIMVADLESQTCKIYRAKQEYYIEEGERLEYINLVSESDFDSSTFIEFSLYFIYTFLASLPTEEKEDLVLVSKDLFDIYEKRVYKTSSLISCFLGDYYISLVGDVKIVIPVKECLDYQEQLSKLLKA